MSVSQQAQAPFKFNYTITEIDEQLKTLAYILKFGARTNRAKTFSEADRWLDKRNECNGG